MTNLIWAANGARAVFLCSGTLGSYQGQNYCDWTRDWFVPKLLAGKRMQSTVLNHHAPSRGGWKLRSVSETVATIQRCIDGRVGPTGCS